MEPTEKNVTKKKDKQKLTLKTLILLIISTHGG